MTALPPYQLTVDGFPEDHFRVHAFTGRETISEVYSFDVVATTPSPDEIERLTPGLRAAFLWNVGKTQRAFYGVLASVRLAGADATSGSVKVHLRVVPRLWLLKRKRRSRIFQKQRVPDVVTAVLREAGITVRWQLKRNYPAREYCTQYEETDYRFIQRLLAESAIYFYFPEGPAVDDAALIAADAVAAAGSVVSDALGSIAGSAVGALAGGAAAAASPVIPGDTVICGDDAAFYPPIGGDDLAELLAATAASYVPDIGGAMGGALGGAMGDGAAAAPGAASGAVSAAVAAFTSAPAPTLYYLSTEGTETAPLDKITRFALSATVRSEHAHFRDYDPERPMLPLTSTAFSTEPFPPTPLQVAAAAAGAAASVIASAAPGAVGDVAGMVAGKASSLTGGKLEVYDHHAGFLFPKWAFADDEAARILRQKRRRASIAAGESGCPDLSPGHRFALDDHPISQLDKPYVVTSVQHRGEAYPQAGGDRKRYTCTFECAPATVTYVPPRPKRQSVQVSLTATVVGPPGEEIYVDPMGQIKVQFHWDRQGRYDDKSSCWIRTMHPWGGAGWGVQFIPRIGMEVVVVFEGGDPDKPMVMGTLYNGTHPSPFPLPGDKTRSGWRTQSSPGGGGFNELSFEDQKNAEQVYLHAQRDLDEVVERDHTLKVGRDERMQIDHDQVLRVGHDQTINVGGDRCDQVTGKRETAIGQDDSLRVEGARYVNSLDAQSETRRNEISTVAGNARREVIGMANERVKDDKTVRVDGNYTTVVGKHDAKRTFVVHAEGRAVVQSSELTEIASEKELVLRCGASRIRITPERIEFASGAGLSLRSGNTVVEVTPEKARIRSTGKAIISAESINILTDGAQVKLTDDVKITGSKVKLNPPKTDQEKSEDPKPPKPTKINFKDQEGRPLANQRFVIHFDDGSEVAGVLDYDGNAELELEGSGAKISFPEVSEVKS